MTVLAPAAPGRLGEPADPPRYLTYLTTLDDWIAGRRAELDELDLDAAAIVAYGGIVPPAGLRIPRHGWINLHFSVLPAWRGAAPVQHSVLAGDDVTDENAMRELGPADLGIKVGTGQSVAAHRVASPEDLAAALIRLSELRRGALP